MESGRDNRPVIFFFIVVILVIGVGLFTPLRDNVGFHVNQMRTLLFLKMHPPKEAVFVPQEQSKIEAQMILTQTREAAVSVTRTEQFHATKTALAFKKTVSAAATAVANLSSKTPDVVPSQTPEPTLTPIPLPSSHFIANVPFISQHGLWNYCAPTTLAMYLNFWGYNISREKVGEVVHPFEQDKNVMIYELEAFVSEKTNLHTAHRSGGTPELVKKMVANGFPVMIEKGTLLREINGQISWLGHYNLITGYDDEKSEWTVNDSYYAANHIISYEQLQKEWRSFNYQFLIIYPQEMETAVYELLGPYTNSNYANGQALAISESEIEGQTDKEILFYAYFNRGTSLVAKQDYFGASVSFDMAFSTYFDLETDKRPYRMVWYQTAPYAAYYYTGRYYDLIDLATNTLGSTNDPYLEETFYWRARAYLALGDIDKAKEDTRRCLNLHPGFPACKSFAQENNFGW